MKSSIVKEIVLFIISAVLIISCNQCDSGKSKKEGSADTSLSIKSNVIPLPDSNNTKTNIIIDGGIKRRPDTSLLMKVSAEILKYIKAKNYERFAFFIHPADSIRFSPYAFVDTRDNLTLSRNQFIRLVKQNKAINWNTSWERDTIETLTVDQYFKKFVYDVDFLNAELKSINQFHSQGTDLNNIKEVYPNCDVVELFFSGFDKKYGGMDFRALRLVYKLKNNKPFLAGVVHDEWTP
ncbi:MAG TPA: hypothetical protein VI461_06540 [Chitinophagaceae bacterium]|nr:hypothetical protein [Chitinophagaceae bacterium]